MDDADRDLWDAWCNRRDGDAFRAAVIPHLPFARDLAGRAFRDPGQADEAVQLALVRLAREPGDRPVQVGFRAWIGRAVILEGRMQRRSEARRARRERHAARPEPTGAAERSEVSRAVSAALDALPAPQREAVILHHLHDVPYAEMARILGASEGACRLRVHKGIERLRTRFGAETAALLASMPLLVGRPAHAAVSMALAPAATMAAASPPLLLGAFVMNKVVWFGCAAALAAGSYLVLRSTDPSSGDAPHPSDSHASAVAEVSPPPGPQLAGALPDGPGLHPAAPAQPPAPAASTTAADPDAAWIQGALAEGVEIRAGPALRDVKSVNDLRGERVRSIRAQRTGNLAWLSVATNLSNLRTLDLATSPATDAHLAALPVLPVLEELTLDRTLVTAASLPVIARMAALKKLDLGHTKALGPELALLGPLRDLSQLVLQGSGATDADLEHVGRLERIEYLDIHDTKVTDEGLGHLRGLVRLRALDVSETRISGRGFQELVGLPRLAKLYLDATALDADGFASLARLPHLEKLSIENVRALDAWLEPFKAHPTLENIETEGASFTDAVFTTLREIPKLKRILLRRSEVTDAGIERFLAERPKVRVER